jgi:hypothetical protein
MTRFIQGVLLSGTFLFLSTGVIAQDITSIQLVGRFEGITCEPDDPVNNMDNVDPHLWSKLKFINEPGSPDTIYFKFTMNGSYWPENWGWSGTWGIAELAENPPSIATVLADSGYYYFHFDDTSYAYDLDRPTGVIEGSLSSEGTPGAPPGAEVALLDEGYNQIGMCCNFSDPTFSFNNLPTAIFHLIASAPGYRDTTITDIDLNDGETLSFSLNLETTTAVTFSSATYERNVEGVLLTWQVSCCTYKPAFDIFRGSEPFLETMQKRNVLPVYTDDGFRYFDECEDPTADYYYFIVETGDDNPSNYGPMFIKGIIPDAHNSLGRNYPNPFNPSTTIPYTIGPSGRNQAVRIAFYDVAGRLVDRFSLGMKPIGSHTFTWNPAMTRQGNIPSGVYYCRLQIGKEFFTRKLILLR